MRTITLLFVGCILAGCVTSPTGTPDITEGQKAWIHALQSGEPVRVWSMLSEGSRAHFKNRNEFDAWFERHGANLLVHAIGALNLHLRIQMKSGVVLVKERGSYRIDVPITLGRATTLKQTLQVFSMTWKPPLGLSDALVERYKRLHKLMLEAMGPGWLEPPKNEKNVRLKFGSGAEIQFKRTGQDLVVASWKLPQ